MASTPQTATILVVDDTPESLGFVTAALEAAGYTVLVAGDGAAALQSLALVLPDLVIMDAMMPVIDGFETTRRIKADPRLAVLPVVFMTGLTETEHVVRGLQAGGVDYVTKPIVVDELLARIRVHLGNARITQGSQSALDDSGRPLLALDSTGRILWSTPRTMLILAASFPNAALPPTVITRLIRLAETDEKGVLRHEIPGGRLEFTLLTRSGPDEWLFRLAEIREGAEERLLATRHNLTDREAEVLLWISRGKANREISEILGISPRTVDKHLEQVFEKMGIENRASAAAAAVKTLTQ
ncbi:DNA-binding response regulator [Polymorphobacter glacialis]|uniref:DNA-binding response regulator n=1 Tax=Sandarakinorhabdus glacialis TaxID=1614636 RepID=A0A916ZP17_9SPHN|nr:response regulator [Polymorphobacter glacialis]GGE07285.1 DNA-binding response regulator [Polymorphobacter glacialis]